jgi:RimJ/RimL family protein N-acetyltransferase
VAIIHPENSASQRVAEKIGLLVAGEDRDGGPLVRIVLATPLDGSRSRPEEG